jgi:hypothetical protein
LLIIGGAVLIYLKARRWNRRSIESVRHAEEVAARLKPLQDGQDELRDILPKLLQLVGEQPLTLQDQGAPFSPEALATLEEIDHVAYLGNAKLSFRNLESPAQLAVYLNGLLLSAAARIARSDPWTALSRFDQIFDLVRSRPDAIDPHRIAQAYSYRALADYQILEMQDREPSWVRKSERTQVETLSRQAFSDIAQSLNFDQGWKHAKFVEALLCSRFYFPEGTSENESRSDLYIRGLRRAVGLYKELIDEKQYRGPARHQLAVCLKRIAEQTGEKSDFSDFGYTLSGFPTDEELADEALASRQPYSPDRFLWQELLGDQELFHSIERINASEYRLFWIRLLDNKVHLRNWRADLGELQQRRPGMRHWTIQILHAEGPISLANSSLRRQDRFDAPAAPGS